MSEFMTSEEFLQHHGVKGMKWGVTRDEATLRRLSGTKTKAAGGTKAERKAANKQAKSDWKSYKKSTSRKERKADSKAAKASKADYILDSIAKNPENTLVKLKGPGGARVLATGNEVMNYLERGGAMDMRYTDIVAVLPSEKKN